MGQRSVPDEDPPLTFACPGCGRELRIGSHGCPHCDGPEAERGNRKPWEQDEYLDGLDLPEDSEKFDYDAFLERELGRRRNHRNDSWISRERILQLIAFVLLLLMLLAVSLGTL